MRGTARERSPGVWQLRIYVGNDPATGNPKQLSRTVHTKNRGGKGEALAALADFYAEVEGRGLRRGSEHTVGSLMAAYIARCEALGRKRSTIESYEMAEKRLTPELRATRLRDLSVEQLDRFYWGLEMAQATVKQQHGVMRAALGQALAWDWISINVAERATPTGKVDKVERKPLALADIATMAKKADTDGDLVLAAAVVVAALTGARRGELAALRWDDIDPVAGTLTIERQLVPGKGGDYLTSPKSSIGTRSVYLGHDGLAFIDRYRYRLRVLMHVEPWGYLLTYDGDTPVAPKTLAAQLSSLGKKCGLVVTTHSFRRAAATQLVAAGVDVDSAARRMGHTKEVMLGSYVLGAEDRQQAAADTVEDRYTEMGLPLGELMAP